MTLPLCLYILETPWLAFRQVVRQSVNDYDQQNDKEVVRIVGIGIVGCSLSGEVRLRYLFWTDPIVIFVVHRIHFARLSQVPEKWLVLGLDSGTGSAYYLLLLHGYFRTMNENKFSLRS